MGTFRVGIEVGNPSREEFVAVEALVDTGAIYTMLPEDLLDRLGVPRLETDIFELADDSLVEYWIGSASVRIQERTLPVPVVFARPDNTPLLGATTLEILRFIINPMEQRLVPSPPIKARPV